LSGAEEWKNLMQISDRTVKSAQIFMGALPILMVYPFLQRYFVKGIVLGSVKG
jgi:putative aldouronate transport system permease protein